MRIDIPDEVVDTAVLLAACALLEARLVDAMRNANDGNVRARFHERGDAVKIEAARKAPVVLEVQHVGRAELSVVRIDGAHLTELRQVDAYIGDGEVAHETCRGRG